MKPSFHQNVTFVLFFFLLFMFVTVGQVSAATRILEVNETDFVKLIPKAVDPDFDEIVYTFSSPLDSKGEWQTTYDDEGSYNITVTASDGKETVSSQILLIVHHKNQAPMISQSKVILKETQTVDLKLLVEDPDSDALEYQFNPPFNKDGLYNTNYNDSGIWIVHFNVSDGEFMVGGRIELQIENTNQPPLIKNSFNNNTEFDIKEGDFLNFFVDLSDEDPDKLTILWTIDNKSISDKINGTYLFGFDESGDHTLLFTANDGLIETSRTWLVHVQNTNRAPKVTYSEILADEGDNIILELPLVDEDNESVSYTFSEPFTSIGQWQTTYDDAGKHNVTVTATDQILATTVTIPIVITDVDRAPLLVLPRELQVREGSILSWTIETQDPDGDNITLNITGLPPSAVLDLQTRTLNWTPSYDELRRRGGFISNVLNTLRLEQFFISSKTIIFYVESCGKRWCSKGSVPIKVYNVNRAPILNSTLPINLTETQTLYFEASAVDPDGDIIHYYYTDPLTDNKWTPSITDQGPHTIYVTATDGQYQDTKPVEVNVQKFNQPPALILPGDDFTILEGQQIQFPVSGFDADGDNLTLRIFDLPPGASFRDGLFSWTPGHDVIVNKTDTIRNNFVAMSNITIRRFSSEKKVYFMRFGASDAEIEAIHPVKITVKNDNLAPAIVSATQSTTVAKLGEPVRFEIDAQDLDVNDQLLYSWVTSWSEPRVHNTVKLERIFKSPGHKRVSVYVSDGRDEVEHTFDVQVNNELYNPPVPPVPTYKVFVIEHQ